MVCPTTAFATWDSTNLCVVLSFIAGKRKDKYDKDHRKSISLLKLGDTVRILNPERKGDFGKKYNPILS